MVSWWRRFLHNIGACPKQYYGYSCQGRDGECGWTKLER